jgi:tetratricopeptide (TPR) repeat protein
MSDPRLDEVERAIELISQGRGKQALFILDDLIARSSHPHDVVQLLSLAAGAEREMGNLEAAAERLRSAKALLNSVHEPEIESALFLEMFRYLVAIGDHTSALHYGNLVEAASRQLRHLDETSSILDEIKVQKAICLACLNRHAEAVIALKEALGIGQPDGALWFYLGHCEIALKNHPSALRSLREAASRSVPRNLESTLYYDLALASFHLGELREAKTSLERAISSEPSEPLKEQISTLAKKLEGPVRVN